MANDVKMITGEEKRIIYAELKTKLKIALNKDFYYEAVMLEYAIIEDRTASILLHSGICANPFNKKLSEKLSSLEHQYGKAHPIISKKFDISLVERIRVWKQMRNNAVHRACIFPYSKDQMKDIVIEGNELVKLVENCAKRVSNATQKKR